MFLTEKGRIFLDCLSKTLLDRNLSDPAALLARMRQRAGEDDTVAAGLAAWAEDGRTSALFALGDHFGDRKNLAFFNLISELDGAVLQVIGQLPLTGRVERLFPAEEIGAGWSLSLQADKAGYRCRPAEHYDHLEDYETVEAAIFHIGMNVVDPATLGLPERTAARFLMCVNADGPALGLNLDWRDVNALRAALAVADPAKGHGVPRGTIGWAGAELFIGAGRAEAEDMMDVGFSVSDAFRETGRVPAVSEASKATGEVVMRVRLRDDSCIIDLRSMKDREDFRAFADKRSDDDFGRIMRKQGIAALYDPETDQLEIFKPGAVRMIRIEPEPEPAPADDLPTP